MDPAQLTQTLWETLKPYLPVLLTEAAKAGGKRVPEAIGRLWQEITDRLRKRPAAAEALADLQAAPDDADAQAALRLQVRKLLAADEALAAQLADLLQQAGARYRAELHGDGAIAQGPGATATGSRSVFIGGDAQGNIIVTGDGNRVRDVDKEEDDGL